MFETALRESVMSARRQLERAYLDALQLPGPPARGAVA
jgi:hypothetical protein